MAAVVDEAGVLELLVRSGGHRAWRASGAGRPAAAGVDDQIGAQLVAVLGDDPGDVRDAVDRRCVGEHARSRPHRDDLEPRLDGSHGGDDRLDDRTAPRERA